MIDTLMLMTGIDIPIPELQIQMHQPTIKEISMMGEKNFFIALQFLTLKKESYFEDKRVLEQVSNFQIFMTVINENPKKFGIDINIKNCVIQLLSLLFDKYKIIFTPQSIIISKDNNNAIIDDQNFEKFQEMLSLVFCLNTQSNSNTNYNPANKKAKEIAEKLMRGRQKVAALKGDKSESLFTRYISVLSVGIPMSLAQLLDSTPFQIYDLLERFTLFQDWDINMKVRLAGGTSNEQVESFMKEIH